MKKILAIRTDRFGEFLLNIPAFRAIKESFSGVTLSVAASESVAPLARAVPFIDEVIVWPAMPWSVARTLALAADLRRRRFDAAAVLNSSVYAHHAVFLAGIPFRVGYRRKHACLLTATLKDEKDLGRKHEVEHNLELVGLLGASTEDRSLVLCVPADVRARVDAEFGFLKDERPVAVHPWTSDPVKQWPLERFLELVKALAGRHRVVLIGRPEDWHKPLEVRGLPNVLDLSRRTTLLEAAAVLERCRVLVSCDSGPVHLACAVGTPVVALFRNDMPGKNPERWGPWGDKNVVVQTSSLEGIAVQDVLEKVECFLSCRSSGGMND
jgi:ADP-heptose:LPS heptosyltransferase